MKVLFLLTEFFLSASVGPVAQLVEHQTEDLGVGGSNPPRSAKYQLKIRISFRYTAGV